MFRGVKTVNAPGRRPRSWPPWTWTATTYYPAVEQFALSNDAVPSPAVRSTADEGHLPDLGQRAEHPGKAPAAIGVIVEPLVLWLWVGGFVIIVGASLSLWPSSRDRHSVLEEGADAAPAGQGASSRAAKSPRRRASGHMTEEPYDRYGRREPSGRDRPRGSGAREP